VSLLRKWTDEFEEVSSDYSFAFRTASAIKHRERKSASFKIAAICWGSSVAQRIASAPLN
jgi:hypothetical protein